VAVAPFRLGLHVLTYGSSWPDALATVRGADEAGFDDVFGADHLFATGGDPLQPFFEGWTMLAAWAQATSRVRVGLLVGANAFRNPAVVAKMAATIDHISGGRFVLGLGAAWYDEEIRRHGLDPGAGIGERLDWLDEALGLIRRLLAGETVTHEGPQYRFDAVHHAPGPLQASVPVLLGGEGERKGLRIVARHADIWHMWVPPDSTERFRAKDAVLREHCAAVGRDQSAIMRLPGAKVVIRDDPEEARRAFADLVALHGWPEYVWEHAWLGDPAWIAERLRAYREAGAGGFVAQVIQPFDHETIERLAREVRPALVEHTEAVR
jgi:alkanesulfonate monooxygenase SsuD/methylene tetrahydromethanopterin reductase-like flavin-dependent oxidoreductase (luciferase family)